MAMETVTKNKAASNDEEIVPSDVGPIVDIATFMKQPFTKTDIWAVNYHMTFSVLCMFSSTKNGQLTNILRFLLIDA